MTPKISPEEFQTQIFFFFLMEFSKIPSSIKSTISVVYSIIMGAVLLLLGWLEKYGRAEGFSPGTIKYAS